MRGVRRELDEARASRSDNFPGEDGRSEEEGGGQEQDGAFRSPAHCDSPRRSQDTPCHGSSAVPPAGMRLGALPGIADAEGCAGPDTGKRSSFRYPGVNPSPSENAFVRGIGRVLDVAITLPGHSVAYGRSEGGHASLPAQGVGFLLQAEDIASGEDEHPFVGV